MDPLVTIIICTCNRAAELQQTLLALGRARLPAGAAAELIVVDNGSTDHTREVVERTLVIGVPVTYAFENRQGQSHARNLGLERARGRLILFTDDDVRPAESWIEEMVKALTTGERDAVVGQILAAPHLRRSWLGPQHGVWLAAPEGVRRSGPELIGANMGFCRSVLGRVPQFDPELGPGALGFGDDSLFSWQLVEAGFRVQSVPEAKVVHHFDVSRLRRSAWLDAARKRGRTQAYLLHHWFHGRLRNPKLRIGWLTAKLELRRRCAQLPALTDEGCPCWEMSYVMHIAKCQQFMIECGRPRNYACRGLRRCSAGGTKEVENSMPVAEHPGVARLNIL